METNLARHETSHDQQYFHPLKAPRWWLAVGFLALLTDPIGLFGQGTGFTYQGRLTDGGGPANGWYNFSFSLYSNNLNGAPVGGTLTNSNVAVSNGLFTAVLDFGPVFEGTAYWLEIGVQSAGRACW